VVVSSAVPSGPFDARPAREATEAVAVAVFEFGIVVLCGESVECLVVGCILNDSYAFFLFSSFRVVRYRIDRESPKIPNLDV
jgi:hypothetical protein